MMTLTLRRQAEKGGKGAWVRNERTREFVPYSRIVSQANSGNLTVEWRLEPGTYTYQENWYGKITRETITVPAPKLVRDPAGRTCPDCAEALGEILPLDSQGTCHGCGSNYGKADAR